LSHLALPSPIFPHPDELFGICGGGTMSNLSQLLVDYEIGLRCENCLCENISKEIIKIVATMFRQKQTK
jgi:hypothetical protein